MCFGLLGDASGGVCSPIWVVRLEDRMKGTCFWCSGVYDTPVYISGVKIMLPARIVFMVTDLGTLSVFHC